MNGKNLRLKFEHKVFDTNFFGFPVFQLHPPFIIEELETALEMLPQNEKVLVYSFLEPESRESAVLKSLGANRIGLRNRYEKQVSGDIEIPDNIHLYPAGSDWNNLKLLAIQSAEYSRFAIDNNFSRQQVIDMYESWIKNAVNGEFDDCVYCAKDDNQWIGLVTLRFLKQSTEIGLIVTDKSFRGTGIGRTLLQAAQSIAGGRQGELLSVVTQAENREACAFYESAGLTMTNQEEVFHLWL